jgi:hypothetical protein
MLKSGQVCYSKLQPRLIAALTLSLSVNGLHRCA